MSSGNTRILVVDDEEAILETMTFTFEDDYEVLTSTSAAKALDLLDENAPIAVVISDQRMPEMTGVEFLARVFERHPETTRIILTGFADMEATIRAINDGHVYAYVTKPWEPEDLRQVIRRAVDHHVLTVENDRLVRELGNTNLFLQAVADEIDTGALAVDALGIVRVANRPAREYLGLDSDPSGRALKELLGSQTLAGVSAAATRVESDDAITYEDLELCGSAGCNLRLRIRVKKLGEPDGRELGRVILVREISHEPLRIRFDEVLAFLAREEGELRRPLQEAKVALRELAEQAGGSRVRSPGMAELSDRAAGTITAIDAWLAVDDLLSREDYPDAQLLMDRMRLASSRWPLPDRLPARVRALAERVESYYESGENPKQPTL